MSKNKNKLLIFTKSPVLGEVKTRLQPDYSQEQSLTVHKNLLLNTLTKIKGVEGIDIELCCTPNRATMFFLNCENKFPISLSNQYGADLGERMAFAFSVALQTYENVVVIGTDCPDINEAYISQAFVSLEKSNAVIGPAVDGGYVLLGLRKYSREIFENISWGSGTVFVQTENALNELSWSYTELDIMHDVDRPEDLQRYPELLNEMSEGN